MKRWIKRLVLSFLLVVPLVYFLFCYSRVDTDALGSNPVTYKAMEKGRWISEEGTEIEAPLKLEIVAWFAENRHGWAPSIVTYVPRHVFYGEQIGINITGDMIVVNYMRTKSKKAHTQITRHLSRRDREFWHRMVDGAAGSKGQINPGSRQFLAQPDPPVTLSPWK